MSIIRKPSELEAKKTISLLIYGQPGVGKSTLGMSAPNAVLFDYDGGVNRMNGAHIGLTVQVRSWEDTQAALDEIKAELPDVQTIVIDTAGKMLDYMSEYIMRTNTRMRKADGTLSLQGYGLRKNMFVDFIKQATLLGKNVIFVAHEKEEKRGDETIKRPEIGGSSANDLVKELDLVGYVQMIGKQRTIAFNPTEWYYAKNTCNLPAAINIPVVVDENGTAVKENVFVSEILKIYNHSQDQKRELTKKYDELMATIDTALQGVKTLEDINNLVDSLAKSEQVYNSQMAGNIKIYRKATALGFKYNKLSKHYEA